MAAGGLRLADMLARIAETGRSLIGAEEPQSLIERARVILGGEGEVSGTARARGFLDAYRALDHEARLDFLRQASTGLGADPAALKAAIERYEASGEDIDARALHLAAEPRSQELIRRLNRAPGAMPDLLAMREDLLRHLREDPALAALDEDFRHLFSSWFNRGFLELRRIDWNTPAAILEKIIRYEAVHEIRDWSDLRRRVAAPDRQLYAFFHPALPGEPLIFVEVALTADIPAAIEPILAAGRETLDPAKARTAVFYSISNCQNGLRGVSFGNFLIKQVVEELSAEFPSVETFVTLSPVPGLRGWSVREGIEEPSGDALGPLAARYLVEAKRPGGAPVDAVARFHLGNGARLERINLDADRSERGQSQGWGVMVNYLYDLRDIEKNHEAFAESGVVAHSAAVRRLVKQAAQAGQAGGVRA
ncbi:malonyl-CoA decarboxylase [Limibaculum sp. M0105]|uniref:Malonyl-CoA decarboxylase n=1 Tax=Thermohalobaculum xanthum TaxID=2753746 RepID=A0A8J7SBW6_9RHOB|nr:malonyl-CoA decarboxylase [Thermohalobaculum xanthum]MBK0399152.1 malonyl-CoA decarboxylase [Thermohalobaculum xanthum]